MKEVLRREVPKAVTRLHRAFRQGLYHVIGAFSETVTVNTLQGRLTVSTRDSVIAAELFRRRYYEFDASMNAVHFLKASGFVPSENLCMLDIGANIGLISTGLLLSGQVAKSIAIEPEPGNFALLERNMAQNGLSDRAYCLQLAVGDREATLEMELSPINHGDHRVRTRPAAGAVEQEQESSRPTVAVSSLPLSRILELPEVRAFTDAPPAMLWIDVQGFEGYAFLGGKEYLAQGIPAVSEVWPYGILRAGMSLEQYIEIVSGTWSDYWVERRGRYTRYPISVLDRYLDEIGTGEHYENVIFTRGAPAHAGNEGD